MRILLQLGTWLNVHPSEWRAVSLFFGALFVLATGAACARGIGMTLLVGKLGTAILPFIFVLIDAGVMLGTLGYTRYSQRIPSLRIWMGLIICLMVLTGLAQWLFRFAWGYAGFFIGFSFLLIMISIHTTNVLILYFNVPQLKRLTSLIYSGTPLGGITGGIILVTGVAYWPPQWLLNVLVLACLLVLGLLRLMQISINPLHSEKPSGHTASELSKPVADSTQTWFYLTRSRLLLTLAFSLFIYVLISRLLEYQYQGMIYPQAFPDLNARADFFGRYEIIANSIALILQILVSSRLIVRLGVGASNLLYPLLQLCAALSLLLQFGLISGILTQFINQELKTAIRAPAFQLLLNALPPGRATLSRSLLNGLVFPLATFTASGFLVLAKLLWEPAILAQLLPLICLLLALVSLVLVFPQWKQYNRGMFALLQQNTALERSPASLSQEMADAFNRQQPSAVMAALQMVATLKDETFIDAVGKVLLRTDNWELKRQAMITLTQFPHSGVGLVYMNKAIRFEGDPTTLVLLLQNLQLWEDKPLANMVERFLLHPYPGVFTAAVLCLYHNRHYSTKPLLVQRLLTRMQHAPVPHIPQYLETVAKLQDRQYESVITHYLDSADNTIRVAALKAITELSAQNLNPYQSYYLRALTSPWAEEQHLALTALQSCAAPPNWMPVLILLNSPNPEIVTASQSLISLNIQNCKSLLIEQVFSGNISTNTQFLMLQLIGRRLTTAQQTQLYHQGLQALQESIRFHALRLSLPLKDKDDTLQQSQQQALFHALAIATYHAEGTAEFLQQVHQGLCSAQRTRQGYALEVLSHVRKQPLIHLISAYFENEPDTIVAIQERYLALFQKPLQT